MTWDWILGEVGPHTQFGPSTEGACRGMKRGEELQPSGPLELL